MIVGSNDTFEMADHDFTKFGIIPSVSFFVDIPEDVGIMAMYHWPHIVIRQS